MVRASEVIGEGRRDRNSIRGCGVERGGKCGRCGRRGREGERADERTEEGWKDINSLVRRFDACE